MTLPISHRIGPALPGDLPEVHELLRSVGLPTEGLEPFVDNILVSRSRGRIIGCAALEIYGAAALLRSVAVDAGWQGRGLGADLEEKARVLARSRGVRDLFLLTTTAAEYFERRGFSRCTREEVPQDMRGSLQFTSQCPSSAVVMRRGVGVSG